MENCEELECLEDRVAIPGSDLMASAASVVLGATLTCVGSHIPRPPGIESLSADRTSGAYISPIDDLSWHRLPGIEAFNSPDTYFLNASPVGNHLEGLVSNLTLPKAWQNEGIEPPSRACVQYSLEVLRRLFDNYGIIPYKTTMSKDGGIFAAYKTPYNKNILRIEVDNDLDVVAVVSDGSEILESDLLEADDRERSLIANFSCRMA